MVRVDAQLLAGVGLQREVGVTHHLLGELASTIGVDATRLVDLRQLDRLDVRVAAQLPALDVELALEQLVLRLHRDVLTRCHRHRARDESRQTGEPHDPRAGIRRRRHRG